MVIGLKRKERRGRLILEIQIGKSVRRFEWTIEPRYWRNPIIAFLIWASLPLILWSAGYYSILSTLVFANVLSIIAVAYSLRVIGTGRLDFGPTFFVAMGGYVAALFSKWYGLSPWETFFLSFLIGMALGALLSPIVVISKGIYYTLITFILPFVLYEITYWRSDIFGAETGIPGVPPLLPIINPVMAELSYFYFSVAIVILYTFIVDKILRSKYGLMMGVLNEDEEIANMYGINTNLIKVIIFIVTSGMISVAGWFLAHYYMSFTGVLYLSPEFLTLTLMAAVLGGKGAVYGAVIGSYFVVGLREFTRMWLGGYSTIVFYASVLMLLLVLPEGLWGLYRKRRYREYVPTIKVRRKT
ncbi:branched-chain amino acid ABC transporter permease [Pyrobaculum aerophilum]|uniref:branched-chain amino acid ABC transporter permease n=1 Tax=Pyrobaculum aerophilum TaxID=13773 RepID=UPI0023F50F2B|nr:branched-chain amino acid ABC transporter permease [Pyrobaculum aerophilum]MCX8137319.1 branched-chain amino acid ABC transporter permease [Pyrobaculum aerophilum]